MTHYEALGVSRTCSESELRKAYYALAVQYHPDKLVEIVDTHQRTLALARWNRVQESYDEIKTPDKRALYDAKLLLLARKCSACKGTGIQQKRNGWELREVVCENCNGAGKIFEDRASYTSVLEM